jgi:hypothetical protein
MKVHHVGFILLILELIGYAAASIDTILGVCMYLYLSYSTCNSYLLCARIVLSSVACLSLSRFFTLSKKRHDFRGKDLESKISALFSFRTFVRNIFHSEKNLARYYKFMYVSKQSTSYLCQILRALEFSRQIFESPQISNFVNIRFLGDE